MLVWVVEHGYSYEGGAPCAAFSSKELAEDWVYEQMKDDDDFGRHGEYYKVWSFSVDEKKNK